MRRSPREPRSPQASSLAPDSARLADHGAARWSAVARGLRLANSRLGAGTMGMFYALWGLIGIGLSLALLVAAACGVVDNFRRAMEPVALYGFILPLALMTASTWIVKLCARFLWCAIPAPPTAAALACAAVVGRLAVLTGAVCLWAWHRPVGEGLLRPQVLACSAVAWLGLATEWGFIRLLRRFPHAAPGSPRPAFDSEVAEATGPEPDSAQQVKGSVWTRRFDPGTWCARRFPTAYRPFGWVMLPLVGVAAASLAESGDLQSLPAALLRLAVAGPALLQPFWVPRGERGALADAISDPIVRAAASLA
jgi:hypothetical protein